MSSLAQGQPVDPSRRLIEALRNPDRYPHPVDAVTVLETHISWVLLAGRFAYKIKKPVDLGFADFSTLERRRRFCEEEIRLNTRMAPDLYLGAIAIGGSHDQPALESGDPAIEYAVKMRRFPEDALASHMLAAGTLRPEHLVQLAERVAAFHAAAPPAAASEPYGEPHSILRNALENITAILAHTASEEDRASLQSLWQWTERHFERLRERFVQRKREGSVRECHGDLHLGNVARLNGGLYAFDGIEFNPNLRWIDVMNEVAFPVMDLAAHERLDMASLFLNEYLERSGDYEGLPLLRFYTVYRALVRAKVECLRMQPAGGTRRLSPAAGRYLALAGRRAQLPRTMLVILHGVSGCGKTTVAGGLMQSLPGVRVRSDVERKRLAGLEPLARSGSAVGAGLYGAVATRATYARLEQLARAILAAGLPAIVDAAFLRRHERDAMRALAREAGAPFRILSLQVDETTLRERLARRAAAGLDASEAGADVLEHQLRTQEPLAPEELDCAVTLDAARPLDAAALVGRLVAEPVTGAGDR